MAAGTRLALRPIGPGDAAAVAALHTASWRSAYRGILRDEFLDGGVVQELDALWAGRFSPLPPAHFGFLAQEVDLAAGFVFAMGAHDPRWGTLVDNLHVLPGHKGRSLGRRLLAAVGEQAGAAWPGLGLYLWVYEQNAPARRFYEGLGGKAVERVVIQVPGGGEAAVWRYAWPDARCLCGPIATKGKSCE